MPQTIRYHSDLKTVQVPQTPNTYTRKHKQPSLPSSQPPPHYCAKPHGECTSLLQNKYSFLKGQISQWKTTYPNSSCTCQLNIIKIPYTRKCFIPSLQRNLKVPLPPERFWLSWMLSFVIRKFQSTTAIRQGRFLFISHTPPPPARHSREPRLAKHTGVRYFAGAGAGAPRGLCQRPAPLCPPGDSSRTTLAQHRARPRWRGTRPARLGEPPAGPGPPPASLAGTRPGSGSGRLLLPPPEGRPGQPQGSLPSPPPALPPTSPTWCGAAAPGSAGSAQRGWGRGRGREGGGERVRRCRRLLPARRAGESLACHGTGDTASCIASGGPSLTPGSSPPPHVSQGPTGCWQRAASARPPQPGPGERRPGASTCGAGPRPGPAPAPPPRLGTPRAASASPAGANQRAGGRPRGPGPLPPPRLRRRWRRSGVGGPDPRQPGTKRFVFPRGAKATVKSAPKSDAKQLPKPQPSCVSSPSNSHNTAADLLAHRGGL